VLKTGINVREIYRANDLRHQKITKVDRTRRAKISLELESPFTGVPDWLPLSLGISWFLS
jgi:hypothetical protein